LYRLYLKDNITLGEGRGNTFIMLLKERREGDCGNAINSRSSGISEGELEIEPFGHYARSLLYSCLACE